MVAVTLKGYEGQTGSVVIEKHSDETTLRCLPEVIRLLKLNMPQVVRVTLDVALCPEDCDHKHNPDCAFSCYEEEK